MSKQEEIARNQIAYITHFKSYLNNLQTPQLSTLFGISTFKQISISMTYQLADTNRTRIEHL